MNSNTSKDYMHVPHHRYHTWIILMTLLAPNTLCTPANFSASSAGKYGASKQSLSHFRRSILQAAHGWWALPCATIWKPIFSFLWNAKGWGVDSCNISIYIAEGGEDTNKMLMGGVTSFFGVLKFQSWVQGSWGGGHLGHVYFDHYVEKKVAISQSRDNTEPNKQFWPKARIFQTHCCYWRHSLVSFQWRNFLFGGIQLCLNWLSYLQNLKKKIAQFASLDFGSVFLCFALEGR